MRNRTHTFGDHLKGWRQRRRLSQLDLATDAQISARHLSFIETGRSAPSREMILHLAERLDVPIRDRNVLLVAAGYAPTFPHRALDDPALTPVRHAIDIVLRAQMPYPAFAFNRRWDIVASNGALPGLYEGIPADLMTPPVNALRLTLHPKGLAPRIANFPEWSAHLLHRLHQQLEVTGDPELAALEQELLSLCPESAPHGADSAAHAPAPPAGTEFVVPFRANTPAGVISFFSTTMVFGTPLDVTLSELAIELFFPADQATIDIVRAIST